MSSVINGLRPSEARNLFVSSMDNDVRSVLSFVLFDVSIELDFVGVGERDLSSSLAGERRSRPRTFSTRS